MEHLGADGNNVGETSASARIAQEADLCAAMVDARLARMTCTTQKARVGDDLLSRFEATFLWRRLDHASELVAHDAWQGISSQRVRRLWEHQWTCIVAMSE
jgi:hypothetical protein